MVFGIAWIPFSVIQVTRVFLAREIVDILVSNQSLVNEKRGAFNES